MNTKIIELYIEREELQRARTISNSWK